MTAFGGMHGVSGEGADTGKSKSNDKSWLGGVYIPTLGAKNAPKMGHPLVAGWSRRRQKQNAGPSTAHRMTRLSE